MARKGKKRGNKKLTRDLLFELYGILILTFSVISLADQGHVGHTLKYLCRVLIGQWDFIIPLIFIYIALYAMIRRTWPKYRTSRKAGIVLFIFGLLVSYHIHLFSQLYPNGDFTASMIWTSTWNAVMDGLQPTLTGEDILRHDIGGGLFGAALYALFYFLFDNAGAKVIQIVLYIIGVILATGWSVVDLGSKMRVSFKGVGGTFRQKFQLWLRERKVNAKAKNKSAAATNTKTAPTPYIPIDDEFDEEFLKPVVKKKNSWLQALQPDRSSTTKRTAFSDEDEEDDEFMAAYMPSSPVVEEKVMYQAPAVTKTEERVQANDEAQGPLIHDFTDHEDHFDMEETVVKREVQPLQQTQVSTDGVDGGAPIVPVLAPYEMPSLNILAKPQSTKGSDTDFMANAKKLEATLESFGVRAKVLQVVRGPAVTRYEIQPDVGVKVSRIVSLTDDIALALAAKDIRMEAPIPGKSAIGIEVPNTEVSIVTMREVMETSAFQDAASRLSITLGRDISGQPIVGNLAKMPHLLVAGATGSGKSVCINGIITSILYKAKPNEVKFMMIDPKMVELNVYNGIPHLLAPVVTDPRRASLALKKIVSEMEKRYEQFSKSGTRNIEGYNAMLTESGTEAPLPYIVVIVDELADLMMVAANDVEDAICRLAQMARAAGIHLIIATQRPSVDVITGVIKANIPSRIAFGVSSQVDSRTILDMVGAEKLLGRGDMLYLPVGASKPVRVQGAFLSDQEVESVVSFVSTQEKANYREELVPEVEETSDQIHDVVDELFEQAVQIVVEAKQASSSLLQRRMRIGYTRAARLMDYMEAKGIVGPSEGSKPREVLMSLEQFNHNRISS
ncbi:DNA translocase FtsK [Paenibacillus sp. N1-5-1-14]|uniref:DNA translocase FtsK n=1 Tax=Paenibacillus radicibacter TaxID=2972488 RepID=UPI002158D74F|nr:DNA translocase FtsK [Paenibacillus radicibacter]MCR8642129.1 DNA translocase FtsK [Paenibacillus radicibacter]